jgi:hypothetical protein
LKAVARLSGGSAAAGVAVVDIDDAIGRGRGDLRTSLNLESLRGEGLVVSLPDGTWALTQDGVARLEQDRVLDR